MTIPVRLREALHDPAFWARYTYAADDGPGAERLGPLKDQLDEAEDADFDEDADEDLPDDDLEVAFEVGGRHRVVLNLDTRLGMYDLGVLGPGETEPAELGWDDLAHWHPFALRWAELELICRAIAVRDPQLPRPGAPLALLCRFAAVFEDDDVDQAVTILDAAYSVLRPREWQGYWPTAADWLARADFRGQQVVWHRDEAGNRWAEQPDDQDLDFYSTRVLPPGALGEQFPHAEFKALLAAAANTMGLSAPS